MHMHILMCILMRILTQLRTATCKVLMHQYINRLLLASLPAVLGGLGGAPGCGPGGGPGDGGDPVLVVSGSERKIHAGEWNSLHIHVFTYLFISMKYPVLTQDKMGIYNALLYARGCICYVYMSVLTSRWCVVVVCYYCTPSWPPSWVDSLHCNVGVHSVPLKSCQVVVGQVAPSVNWLFCATFWCVVYDIVHLSIGVRRR